VKILITGAGGQAGQALLATAPTIAEITALTRQELDLTDTAAMRQALETSASAVVINAAAWTDVDAAEGDEAGAHRVNADAVAALAQACAEQDARLVHLSTDFVFDGRATRPYGPDDPPAPQNAYGRSKLAGEAAALADRRNLVLRTAWVYAAGHRNFVTAVLGKLRAGEELRVVADQVGSPTHARSLAGAIWQLIERDAYGLLHFTDAGAISRYEFALAIRDEAHALGLVASEVPISPVATADLPTLAARPPYSALDSTETLLDQPPRHWRDELRAMLTEERNRGG
jgi:dTDP-4-dehydrorhamnose reductase